MKLRKTSLIKIMNEIKPQWKDGTVQEFLNLSDSEMIAIEARVLGINLIKGDLIKLAKEGRFDYIAHGCNCYKTMDAGIAKAIKENFPEAYQADLNRDNDTEKFVEDYIEDLARDRRCECSKICNFTIAQIGKKLEIFNLYTQILPGPHFNIEYLENCCKAIAGWIEYEYVGENDIAEIGFPWIGCGIGGGNKMEVLKVLAGLHNGDWMGKNCNVTIVEL